MSNERFVVASGETQHSLMISDIEYWLSHEAEIQEWLENVLGNRCRHMGMVLQFDTTRDMMMFMLKWS